MTISEVSQKYGLPADTLRYYEKVGLIYPAGKPQGKRRAGLHRNRLRVGGIYQMYARGGAFY